MEKLNIDEYLEQNGVEITIKGKNYIITDIDYSVREMLQQDNYDEVEVVARILGCTKEEAQTYGVVALTKIITTVMENLFQGLPTLESPSED